MSQYTDKAMELAQKIAQYVDVKNIPAADIFYEQLRQHIEAGPPDCRTCFYFNISRFPLNKRNLDFTCGHGDCINFSKYKSALDYKPICEVTK